ncbi:MAG: hypothetical protein ACRC3Z_07880 [Phocaeicola sp.]
MRERVHQLIEALRVSGREFCASIGQSPSWSRTINKTIGVDVLGNILRKYPQVNILWLIYGEGEMFQEKEATPVNPEATSTFSVNNDYRLICEELRHDNKELREENKNIRELLLKEMQKNQELLIENTQLKVKSYKAGDQ